jgi:hypothetical protein
MDHNYKSRTSIVNCRQTQQSNGGGDCIPKGANEHNYINSYGINHLLEAKRAESINLPQLYCSNRNKLSRDDIEC